MNVLFITYELPPIGGGGGRAALQIARRLARRGHQVRILTSFFAGLPEMEEIEGVRVRRIPVRRTRPDECPPRELLSVMWKSISAARTLAEESRPDVVCAFFGIPGGPAAWRLKRKCGIPYVLSLRGSDVPRPEIARHQRLHLLTRPVLRRIYRDASAVIAVTQGLRDAALAIRPDTEIEVIPNGVDLERFRPVAQPPARGVRPELLFVGRLQEYKGVQHALRALPIVERALGTPVRFTVVGDGPFRAALETLAETVRSEGSRSEARFLGWLEQERLVAIYAASSLLLLPSLVEGHPNVLMEAMACGLPCVASDVAGPKEIISDGGEGALVPPEKPEAIAAAAARILGDAETWRAMSRRARARAEEFSWDSVASRYEAVSRE